MHTDGRLAQDRSAWACFLLPPFKGLLKHSSLVNISQTPVSGAKCKPKGLDYHTTSKGIPARKAFERCKQAIKMEGKHFLDGRELSSKQSGARRQHRFLNALLFSRETQVIVLRFFFPFLRNHRFRQGFVKICPMISVSRPSCICLIIWLPSFIFDAGFLCWSKQPKALLLKANPGL